MKCGAERNRKQIFDEGFSSVLLLTLKGLPSPKTGHDAKAGVGKVRPAERTFQLN
jgi:hypothetical protein